MKGMIKSLVLVIVTSVLFSSCDEQKKELKSMVETMNSECPLPLGDIGSVNSIMFDGEVVEMKFTSNESFAPVSSLSNHQQELKEMLGMSFSKESSDKLVEKIIAAGVNFRSVFVGMQTGEKIVLEVTPNDLKTYAEKYSNMTDQQKLIVTMYIGTKVKLPMAIDNMTKLVGLSLTSDALKYKFEVNDAEAGEYIEATGILKYGALSNMANSLKGGMIGERNRRFYQALIDCNQGAEYEYHELQTGKKSSFRISTDEIREVLNGKWDNQPTAQEWEDLGKAMEEFIETYDNSYDNDDEEPTYYEELVEPVEEDLSTSKECYETAKQLRSEGQGSKAIDLYLRAYRIGESPHKSWALHQIGCTYYFGLGGVKNNYAEAFKYFEMASNLGLLPSKYYLGLCYEYGRGVQKDKIKANEYYAKSGYQDPPGYDF